MLLLNTGFIKGKVFVFVSLILLLLGALGIAYGDELDERLSETREKLGEVRSEVDETRGVVRNYASEVAYYNGLISENAVQMEELQETLVITRGKLLPTEEELEEVRVQLDKSTEILNKRVRSIYQVGNVSYLEVLFEASDFNDFVNRFELLKRVVQQDSETIAQVKSDRQRLDQKKAEIEEQQQALTDLINQQEAVRNELNRKKEERNALLSEAEGNLWDIEAEAARLEEQEQQEHRDGRHIGGGHQQRVVGEVLPLEEGNPHGEHLHLRAAGHDQGPQELVPRPLDHQKREGGQGWPGQRQIDLPVDLEGVGPFQRGRLLEVRRDGQEVLAQQEDAGRRRHRRPDDAPWRVDQPDLRDDEDSAGDRQRQRDHADGDDRWEPALERTKDASRSGAHCVATRVMITSVAICIRPVMPAV